MTTPPDLERTRQGIEALVGMAVRAATSLEEVVDCARAAASLGTPALLELVAARVAHEVEVATASSDAWEAELTYSKIDAWIQTGHKARMLAEAWSLVGPALLAARAGDDRSVPDQLVPDQSPPGQSAPDQVGSRPV
jgi:hypothetical protein